MGPWTPDTCHMPTGSRQMVMSGVNGKRLASDNLMVGGFMGASG